MTRKVAIIGGNRIPFGRSNGRYANASNQDMLTSTIDGLVSRFHLQDERLGMVAAGAVLKHSRDFNLTRECVLGSHLASDTPAFDIQQACGTGLAAAIQVADAISLGRIDSGIAGGVDTTSDAPIALNDDLRKLLIKASPAKTTGQRLQLLGKIRPQLLVPEQPRNGEPRTGLSMGDHAAITAREMGISRQQQDEFAASSHQKLAAAYDEGFFDDLITPYLGLSRDNNLRPDSTVEKLSKLKPVFGKKDAERHGVRATMTAGNSTPLTDGASAVLLASEDWAEQHNLPVRAHLVDSETAAVDFVHGRGRLTPDGLLMAPTYAVPRLLRRNGLTLQDFDFLRDPRSLCLSGVGDARGVGVSGILFAAFGLGRAAGCHRSVQAECEGFVFGSWPSVCGNWRSSLSDGGQAVGAEGIRPRIGIHLCCGRSRCDRDSRTVILVLARCLFHQAGNPLSASEVVCGLGRQGVGLDSRGLVKDVTTPALAVTVKKRMKE